MKSEVLFYLAKLTRPINFRLSKWLIIRWAHSLKNGMGYLVLLNIEFDENNYWFEGETAAERHERMMNEAYASLGLKR